MNKTIRMLINVLPVLLVPLILERQKFKKHPEVQKTVATSKAVARQTSRAITHVKTYVKAKQAEAEQRALHPDNMHARGKKLAKKNSKNIHKLDKKLQKVIDKRQKDEEKVRVRRQKAMKKDMARMQKYAKHVGFVPNSIDSDIEAHGKQLAKRNKKDIHKMDKKLQKSIGKRHKAEDKIREKRQKVMKKQLQALQQYNVKQAHHRNVPRIKTLSDRHNTKDTKYRSDQIHNLSPDL
ncbi:hypothetical protein [Staphylococcus americanisciuri]|uniref:Uncharacterized protein n=1 Tax=Staphylococcus americanisciuri TaxID=2973940 RepID=A0ABT2F256_9STAP|nr:hypothetical protein [Staphylococcus americanisciuri]MCS4486449.1 hypothetical protein [Staphylococcus americanisciuri]